MDPTRHSGHVALVTGAGSGIGRATAIRLAAEGAVVLGLDISDEGLQQTSAEADAAGVVLDLRKADITNQEDVDAAVASLFEGHGHIDILANVAGIMDHFVVAADVDDATWQRVMDVNVTGPMRLIRAVIPGMVERKAGAIINVASVGGFKGGTAGVAYTASKHAVIGLTRNTAWVYAKQGIRCNAVCPGGVNTNIGTTAAPRQPAIMAIFAPIHGAGIGMAQPDDIAAFISWLGSDEARNVNGAIVTDDGGWSAG